MVHWVVKFRAWNPNSSLYLLEATHNPLVLSEDERFLYFGQCFNDESLNGIYRFDIESGDVETIIDGIPHRSSNSMTYKDEILYTPRLFEGRVVKIDLKNNNTVSDVATGLDVPNAVKFDSEGYSTVLTMSLVQFIATTLKTPTILRQITRSSFRLLSSPLTI